MTRQIINVGSSPNSKNGDPLRSAFIKINENFLELYTNQVNADWNSTSGASEILNKPTIPVVPVNVSAFINDSGFITADDLPEPVDLSGYALLSNIPDVSSFITSDDIPFVPTDLSELTDVDNVLSLESLQSPNKNLTVTLTDFGTIETTSLLPTSFTATMDSAHYIEEVPGQGLLIVGDPWYFNVTFNVGPLGDVETIITNNTPWMFNPGYQENMSFEFTELDHYIPNYTFQLQLVNIQNPGPLMWTTNLTATPPPDFPPSLISPNTFKLSVNNNDWIFNNNGDLILPVNSDIKNSAGDSLLTPTVISSHPYLRLTNTPISPLPVTFSSPVSIVSPASGINAHFRIVIDQDSNIESITITNIGSDYHEGQKYRLWSYDIGGSQDSESIDFEISSVDSNGSIIEISNVQFVGPALNTPGTYIDVHPDYQPSVFDEIGPGLILTRGKNQGIYNSAAELDYNPSSPVGTEWNSEGWGNLLDLPSRGYTTWQSALNNAVGNNIISSELVMHDTINNRYYKFDFTDWGSNNGKFSYTRTEIIDPNYFQKPNNIDISDVILPGEIEITRSDSTGIYNPLLESNYSNISPIGTQWNIDGWDDLSNLITRSYTSFETVINGNYNSILDKKFIMYVPSINKYYAIEFLTWGLNGNNSFSYHRFLIDEGQLPEGIRFADNTVLKSAAGLGRVKSTATGNRRIEEVTGQVTVSVTEKLTSNYVSTSNRTTDNNYEIFVARTLELDLILPNFYNNGGGQFQISFDDVTYQNAWLSSIQETEYWFYYENNNNYVPQVQGDSVYIRVLSGADPVVWWNKELLPGGSTDFRGAIIDYHAYTGEATWIGTIYIADGGGTENITHTEVSSGSIYSEHDDLWLVQNEGTISYHRTDGAAKTLKVHWSAKVFYGSEFWEFID